MAYDDLYYEIYEQMNNLKLMLEFEDELNLLKYDDSWKSKSVKDRWEEARQRTLKKYKDDENI